MSVYRRGKTWYIDYYYEGRRMREAVGPNKRAAERALAARETDIQRGNFRLSNPKKNTLTTFSKLYLERHASLKRSGDKDERNLRNHIIPRLGGYRLGSLTPAKIAGYQAERASEAKPATVNRETQLLKVMFNLAIRWGHADTNPVKGLRLLREDNKIQRVLALEEEARLLEESKDPLLSFLKLALNTGLRKGELIDLTWGDVVLDFRQIVVKRSKGGEPRKVRLNAVAHETLNNLKPKDAEPSDRVLPGFDVQYNFKKACKNAKVTGLRVHDLRHTFASRLVGTGADLVTVRDLLGHAVIETTMRYAHSRAHQEAVDRLPIAATISRDDQTASGGVSKKGAMLGAQSAGNSHKTVTGAKSRKRKSP